MKRKNLMLAAAFAVLPCVFSAASRADTTVFSNIPGTLALNYPSQAFQATQTSEFGSEINIAGGSGQQLSSASVVLSDWAIQANNSGFGDSTGFNQDLTLNIYNVGAGPTGVGSLIGSVTQTVHVAWLVPVGVDGTGPYQVDAEGNHYHGLAQLATFNLAAADITVPDQFIYTLAFNTQTYGTHPTGVNGPYNSLNFALVGGTPSVGTYGNADDAFQNSITATGGVLEQVGGFTDSQAGVSFSAVTPVPLPAAAWSGLAFMGALALFGGVKRLCRQAV